MKLEDINKKSIYKVPERYFDQLPMRIQSQVDAQKPANHFTFSWNFAAKIAVPALAMVLLLFYFGIDNSNSGQSTEQLLAMVDTEDIIAYLETTDITTDEILEQIDFSTIELDFANEESMMEDIEMDVEDMDILFDEFGIDSEIL
jgi:hypothetical protein